MMKHHRFSFAVAVLAFLTLPFANSAHADDSEDINAPSEIWSQVGAFPNQGYMPPAVTYTPPAAQKQGNCTYGSPCVQTNVQPKRKSVVGRAARQARGGRDRGGNDDD